MGLPTDGYGIYGGSASSLGSGTWGPQLDAMSAGGFKLNINYNLLFGHATDMIAYINYAATKGMKVLVSLHDPSIWRDNTYATTYPTMYADSSNAGTGIAFMQYIVGQTKSLSGTWGWYVGDEVLNTDHTTHKTYSDAIRTADTTSKPRLLITNGHNATNSTATSTTLFYDCCEVLGDDYYPYGQSAYPYTNALTASNAQAFDATKSLQSCMGLQAFSFANYAVPGAPWPTASQMLQMRNDTINNMTPRVVLWYSYSDVVSAGAPAAQWSDLKSVINAAYGPVYSMATL